MSHTTRTILSAGVVAAATFGAFTAPAHASSTHAGPRAKVAYAQTMIGTWHVGGALKGAPGNVHTGSITLGDGSARLTAIVANDWQCPDASSSPDDGACRLVRSTSGMDFETAARLRIAPGLRSATGSSSVVGDVRVGEGAYVSRRLAIAADFTGAGPLTRQVVDQSDTAGGVFAVVIRSRTAVGSVSVNGVTIPGVKGHIVSETRR